MKRLFPVIFLLTFSLTAWAQREISEDSKLSERLYFGGGLGMNGGTDPYAGRYFFIGVYPVIGYMVNNQLSIGTSLTYQYYSYSDVGQSIHQYGIAPFARYNFGQLFAYTEYSLLSTPTYYGPSMPRRTFDRFLVGIGFSQPLGGRAALNVMGMYDLIWRRGDYAFASPWVFRVFVSF